MVGVDRMVYGKIEGGRVVLEVRVEPLPHLRDRTAVEMAVCGGAKELSGVVWGS